MDGFKPTLFEKYISTIKTRLLFLVCGDERHKYERDRLEPLVDVGPVLDFVPVPKAVAEKQ
jgi:hypothetical protein